MTPDFDLQAEKFDDGWIVSLQARDGRWRIDGAPYLSDPIDQTAAFAALDAFIAEVQRAREAIIRGEDFPSEALS